MARTPDARIEQAKKMFLSGSKLIEIADTLEVPEGTVRSWKNRYKWEEKSNATLQKEKRNVAKEKGLSKEAVEKEINEMLEKSDLSAKHQLFCCLYVKSFNATKAYQKAYGVDYATALRAGPRLLGNVGIKNEIQRLKQNRLNKEMLSAEDIFQKYMDIAFADITDYMDFGTEEVPVMAIYGPVKVKDENTGKERILTKTVNVARFKESTDVDGTILSEVKQGKDGASIKLADRMKALQWLSDHMDIATEEQKARIAVLKAKAAETDPSEIADDGFLEALNRSAAEDWTDEENDSDIPV